MGQVDFLDTASEKTTWWQPHHIWSGPAELEFFDFKLVWRFANRDAR